MAGLDDVFGQAAGGGEVDPTHLRALADRTAALAERIAALAGVLEAVQRGGHARDLKLDRIEGEIKDLRDEVDGILKASSQFTTEQRKTLEDIILGSDRKRWIWAWIRRWALWITSTITFFWLIRDAFPWVGRVIRSVFP